MIYTISEFNIDTYDKGQHDYDRVAYITTNKNMMLSTFSYYIARLKQKMKGYVADVHYDKTTATHYEIIKIRHDGDHIKRIGYYISSFEDEVFTETIVQGGYRDGQIDR